MSTKENFILPAYKIELTCKKQEQVVQEEKLDVKDNVETIKKDKKDKKKRTSSSKNEENLNSNIF
jgi:hypothetical protein